MTVTCGVSRPHCLKSCIGVGFFIVPITTGGRKGSGRGGVETFARSDGLGEMGEMS